MSSKPSLHALARVMVVRSSLHAALLSLVITTSLSAQVRTGARPVLQRDAELALARSAAPAAVSNGARVWIWTGSRYAVADSGTTRVNCYVGRPWVEAVEPHCFDEEGSQSVMPMLMRRVELYAAGRKEDEADREIWADVARGTFRLPSRPAFTYMMSSAQQLVNNSGASVGAWQPHLMIYFPNLTAAGTGLPGFVPDLGFVENPGTPLSAVVIPVKSFVPLPAKK